MTVLTTEDRRLPHETALCYRLAPSLGLILAQTAMDLASNLRDFNGLRVVESGSDPSPFAAEVP